MLDLQVAGAESHPGITADRLAEVWPHVSERLMRLLDKRGLTPTQAEDICQDVAVRVLASEVGFDTAEDLYRWAAHVARNLHVDLLRATSRVQCDDDVLHGMQADTDVEHEVERRIALSKVLRHWLSLRPSDQDALLEGMYSDGEGDRSDAVRRAVRRHRARQRLRLLAKGAFGWLGITQGLPRLRTARVVQTASVAAIAPLVLLSAAPFRTTAPSFAQREASSARVATPAAPVRDTAEDHALRLRRVRDSRASAVTHDQQRDGRQRHWAAELEGYEPEPLLHVGTGGVRTDGGVRTEVGGQQPPPEDNSFVCTNAVGELCVDRLNAQVRP